MIKKKTRENSEKTVSWKLIEIPDRSKDSWNIPREKWYCGIVRNAGVRPPNIFRHVTQSVQVKFNEAQNCIFFGVE